MTYLSINKAKKTNGGHKYNTHNKMKIMHTMK